MWKSFIVGLWRMHMSATTDNAREFGRLYSDDAMNRIKEIRERAGLTQEKLGEILGVTANQIWRLETGRTRLNQHTMNALAQALGVHPADLIANVVTAEVGADVEPYDGHPIVSAIASRGLKAYRVIGRSMVQLAGLAPGDIIAVDESEAAAASPKLGDVCLVEIGADRNRVLRQFLPPNLLVTNRMGANLAINLGDASVNPRIVGVILRGDGASAVLS